MKYNYGRDSNAIYIIIDERRHFPIEKLIIDSCRIMTDRHFKDEPNHKCLDFNIIAKADINYIKKDAEAYMYYLEAIKELANG